MSDTRPKISLVATVLNECVSLETWLAALQRQSFQPDELVVCDGGSTDGTWEILRAAAEKRRREIEAATDAGKRPPPLRVLQKAGADIAAGRNAAITAAAGEIIAVTDAGCLPQDDWTAELVRPFLNDQTVQAVAGSFRYALEAAEEATGKAAGNFRRAAAAYLGRPWEREDFLPSSRSTAFRKKVWEQVGGYPEHLTLAGEDSLFNRRIMEAGFSFTSAPKALVYWPIRDSLRAFLRMTMSYGRGDAEAGLGGGGARRTFLKFAGAFVVSAAAGLVAGLAAGGAFSTVAGVSAGTAAFLALPTAGALFQAYRRRPPLRSLGWFILLTWTAGPAYLLGRLRGKRRL